MKRVIVLTALVLAVSVASASAKSKHHAKAEAKASAAQLYDYAPGVAYQSSQPQIPLILGTTY